MSLVEDMSSTQFVDADLSGAQFASAVLAGVLWTRTRLDGASFFQASLKGADLTDTIGLVNEQLTTAATDAGTKLPEGIVIGRPATG